MFIQIYNRHHLRLNIDVFTWKNGILDSYSGKVDPQMSLEAQIQMYGFRQELSVQEPMKEHLV